MFSLEENNFILQMEHEKLLIKKINCMATQLKKISLLIVTLLGFSTFASAQAQRKANKDTKNWRYELECVSEGVEGTYVLKVFSYSKKATVATEQAKKNAVHGVIFQGIATGGCQAKPALTNNPNLENEKEQFFKEFFADGGKYMKFVQFTNDGAIDPADRTSIGKEYKIGVVVSVKVAALRKDLEDAGIIKGLSSGF